MSFFCLSLWTRKTTFEARFPHGVDFLYVTGSVYYCFHFTIWISNPNWVQLSWCLEQELHDLQTLLLSALVHFFDYLIDPLRILWSFFFPASSMSFLENSGELTKLTAVSERSKLWSFVFWFLIGDDCCDKRLVWLHFQLTFGKFDPISFAIA